jgi:hypothetical protein
MLKFFKNALGLGFVMDLLFLAAFDLLNICLDIGLNLGLNLLSGLVKVNEISFQIVLYFPDVHT